MKANDPWLADAFRLISVTEPDTYARMIASDWRVTVADGPDDLDSILQNDGFMVWFQVVSELGHAFGVTNDDDPANVPADIANRTWLNRGDIIAMAKQLGVPVRDFLADVLVHEYAHHEKHATEPEAFAAGTQFAHEIGSEPIAKLSQVTEQYTT